MSKALQQHGDLETRLASTSAGLEDFGRAEGMIAELENEIDHWSNLCRTVVDRLNWLQDRLEKARALRARAGQAALHTQASLEVLKAASETMRRGKGKA